MNPLFIRSASRLPLGVAARSRFFHTSPVPFDSASTASTSTPPPQVLVRRPVGGFRGGLIGFLVGGIAVGTWGYWSLFDEYQRASNLLLVSVEELKTSANKMNDHVRRIEKVEQDLFSLRKKAATQEDLASLRTEIKKIYDGSHLELLDVKAHLWQMEQDLHALEKKQGQSIRVS